MSTSDKLTYLNETKNKLKEAINLTNANITNDTFRSYEYKLKKGIINTLNNPKAIWDNFEKVESAETAGSITLDPTEYAPMELSFKGNIEQDSTTGKNLFPLDYSLFPKTSNLGNLTATINNKGIIHITGTKSASGWETINLSPANQIIFEANKTYTCASGCAFGCYKVSDNSWVGNKGGTFTPDEDWKANSSYWQTNATGTINVYLYPMIMEGTGTIDESTYEPYTNGASPNPNYPQPIHIVSGDNTIEICGKNLFDVNGITENTAATTNGTENHEVTYSTQNSRAVTLIKVEPNTTYKLSIGDTSYSSRIYFVGMKNTTLESGHSFGWCASGETLTTSAGDNYLLGVIVASQGGTIEKLANAKIQLEKGSTSSEYEPYTGQSQLISLGTIELCKIGDYQDEFFKNTIDSEYYDSTLEQDKWYLKKRIGKVVLDGSDGTASWNSWSVSPISGTNNNMFIRQNWLSDITTTASYNILRCKYFDGTVNSNYQLNGLSRFNKGLRIVLDGTAFPDVSTFLSWCSQNNSIVYYVLATPTNILLNDTLQETLDSFYSYQEQTNISQENNDLPFIIKASAIKEIAETVD